MIYVKDKLNDEGYLLLDSLLTLVILMGIVLFMFPLIVDWLAIHREASSLVEESRQVYEESMQEKSRQPNKIKSQSKEVEVIIYESTFQ